MDPCDECKQCEEKIIEYFSKFVETVIEDSEEQRRILNTFEILSNSLIDKINLVLEDISLFIKNKNVYCKREFDDLTRHLNALNNELAFTRKKMDIDSLTGLFNRKALDEHLEQIIRLNALSSSANIQHTSMIMLDIDHFKNINDMYGHLVGDEVLVEVSRIILKVFSRKTDLAFRYGGDEFAIVIQDTTLKKAVALAEEVRLLIEQSKIGKSQVQLTVSQGVAEYYIEININQWIKRVDNILYRSKHIGRNIVEY